MSSAAITMLIGGGAGNQLRARSVWDNVHSGLISIGMLSTRSNTIGIVAALEKIRRRFAYSKWHLKQYVICRFALAVWQSDSFGVGVPCASLTIKLAIILFRFLFVSYVYAKYPP